MFGDNYFECIFDDDNHTLGRQLQNVEEDLQRLLLVPYFLLMAFVLTSNLMMINDFYKTSRPLTIITKLFIYLSLVDIATTAFRTFYTFQLFLDLNIPCLIIYITIVLMEFTYLLGNAIFATISFLRYWSIKKPLYAVEASRILIILIIQVIVCGLLAGSLLIMIYLDLDPREMVKVIYAIPVSQFLAVSFVLSVNILSYKNLKSTKSMTKLSANVENTPPPRRKTLSEAITCLLYITAFYILCPLPMFILILIGKDLMLSKSWRFYLFIFTQILYMSNTGINSLIVILRTKKLHEFYKIKCCTPKVNSNAQNRRIEMAVI